MIDRQKLNDDPPTVEDSGDDKPLAPIRGPAYDPTADLYADLFGSGVAQSPTYAAKTKSPMAAPLAASMAPGLSAVVPPKMPDSLESTGLKLVQLGDLALKHFPNPKKVLLAGSSAGGWGTVYHRGLVRSQYPDALLTVINDAGIGFAVNGPLVADEWGATRHRPPSCGEPCQTHQHMTYFVKYMLEHDPSTIVGDFSSYGDSVIRLFTFTSDAESFKQVLMQETDIVAQAFPDRYKRFFVAGESHTTLLTAFHTNVIDGVSVAQWVGKMIDRDPSWAELLQQ